MRIFKTVSLVILIGIAAVGMTVTAAQAVTLTISGGQLTGATNVDLGVLGFYTVEFKDGTCASLFTGCDNAADDFAFIKQEDAETAAQALLDQVLIDIDSDGIIRGFDANPILTFRCLSEARCISFIPYEVGSASTFIYAAPHNKADSIFDPLITGDSRSIFFDTDKCCHENFAVFTLETAAIPLPAALPLYGTGLAVMGILGWRRKRQALRV